MNHISSLSNVEKKQYKKWLAYGELKRIEATFGDECYEKALSYVAKKASEWLQHLEDGFDSTVSITNNSRKRAAAPSDVPSNSKKKCESRKGTTKEKESKVKQKTRKMEEEKKKEKKVATKEDAPAVSSLSILPRRRVPYKPKYANVSVGDAARLIIPAYKEFIDSHSTLFSESALHEAESVIDQYHKITVSVVEGRIIGQELLVSISEEVCSLSIQCVNGSIHSILFIKPTSALLQTSPHLIKEDAYQESIQFLQRIHQKFNGIVTSDRSDSTSIDTSICQIFAAANTPLSDPLAGECYEGMIYDVNEDALENPYHVHMKTDYIIVNTRNMVRTLGIFGASPWELSLSKYADPVNDKDQIVRAPSSGSLEEILAILRDEKTCPEGCSIFDDISELKKDSNYTSGNNNPHYSSPVVTNPMDFKTMENKLKQGLYNIDHESLFWSDLESIASNAKRYNQMQRFEWRVADILECTIHRMKADIEFKRIRCT